MFASDRTFRLLRCRRRVPVLQPDEAGVVCPLLDASTGTPFTVSTKKLRRALAGRQRQVLCIARSAARENAFFAGIEEFVGVDPQAGEYVILTPLVNVLGTRHGEPRMALPPMEANPASAQILAVRLPIEGSSAPASQRTEISVLATQRGSASMAGPLFISRERREQSHEVFDRRSSQAI